MVFERLAGYEDMKDFERLYCNPVMRWVVGDRAIAGLPPRPARWAGSRRSGYAGLRTLPRPPICPARPHVRLSTGRPVSQYAGNEGCAG